jgi:hypothetical protein
MRLHKVFVVLLFSFFSIGAANAATTYFWFTGSGSDYVTGATPMQACVAYYAKTRPDYSVVSLTQRSQTQYYCVYKVTATGQGPFNGVTASRSGDSCAAGYVLNTTTGLCDVSQCKAKEGRFATFASSALLPGSACIGGCAAALPQQHKYTNPKTGITTYYYEGNYTGNDCSGANPAGYTQCNLEQDCTKDLSAPEVEKSNECQVAQTGTDANGKPYTVINCTDTEISQQQQDNNCNWGTAGAGAENNWSCATKPGKNNETKTETSTKTTTNPDGSKDTQQTITKTETKCTGVNSCTTSTTTTTNNNHTNADGSPGNSSSSCKGTSCPSTDGDGESEEEGDDDIAGPTKSLVGKASEGFGEEEAQWQKKIDAGRQQLDGLIKQYSNLFSGAFDLNLGGGSASLPCYSIPIRTPQINTNLEFCPAKFEDQLIYLKYILLACATILAGFIILRD